MSADAGHPQTHEPAHEHPREHRHGASAPPTEDLFEPAGWDERYAGDGRTWSGRPNAALVAEASTLPPGTALDVGCGEGGDVVWLAQQGWTVTGADFSEAGLARARTHAEEAGVGERCDWWRADARDLDPQERRWDLVTTHFLHPAGGTMVDVVHRLAGAVAPGGHLLVVGHAPVHHVDGPEWMLRAMFRAADVVPGLEGTGLEVVTAEQRARRQVRDGQEMDVEDSVLLARRPADPTS